MKLCPFRFTRTFNTNLRTVFFVPNFGKTMESIKSQFKAGVAEMVEPDVYQVMIRDIPALVVMRNATLIDVRTA